MPTPRPKLASAAFLIADPARAAMLMTLIDGRALPAGQLAHAAGVSAQTASSHLARLLDGGMVEVEVQGRHRYYRLANPQVAQALESLAVVAAPEQCRPRPHRPGQQERALKFARCCYDHLAGQLGVTVTRSLLLRGLIAEADGKQFRLTGAGADWCACRGIDLADPKPGCAGLARRCLDWTERRHHLGGPLGVRLLAWMVARQWVRRPQGSRAVEVTPGGWEALRIEFGIVRQAEDELALIGGPVSALPA